VLTVVARIGAMKKTTLILGPVIWRELGEQGARPR